MLALTAKQGAMVEPVPARSEPLEPVKRRQVAGRVREGDHFAVDHIPACLAVEPLRQGGYPSTSAIVTPRVANPANVQASARGSSVACAAPRDGRREDRLGMVQQAIQEVGFLDRMGQILYFGDQLY